MKNKKVRLFFRTFVLLLFVAAVVFVIFNNYQRKNDYISEGDAAPDFKLTTLNGDEIQLSSYKGEKGVFLNFWATYCPPCEEEMPYIENGYQKFKDLGVEVLAIDVAEPKLIVEQFVERKGMTFPVLLDKNSTVMQEYGVGPIPVSFLIDKDGKVVKRITGRLTQEGVYDFMNSIMPEQK